MHLDKPPQKEEPHNFKFYCKPANLAKIIGNRKLIFGSWGLVGYLIQFFYIIAGLNHYSDNERFLPCDTSRPITDVDAHS